jgi:hypothetical protein
LHELGEVSGSIDIPIKTDPARIAIEGALTQAELGFHPSTGRARFG